MKIPVAFGLILKKARKASGISQDKLALKSKVNRTYISFGARERQPTITVWQAGGEGSVYK
jgi:transcriptional regulator with XRE-family HTH domain